MLQITEYTIQANLRTPLRIALAADLHDRPEAEALAALKKGKPDLIAVCGDMLNARITGSSIYDELPGGNRHLKNADHARAFLKYAAGIAPVFFTTGNHELYFDEEDREQLKEFGVVFLDNTFVRYKDLVIGGLSSPYSVLAGTGKSRNSEESDFRWKKIFDSVRLSWLEEFETKGGYKILLCHHPELYERYLKQHESIDLILSGHTHGGQIRLFGQGLFAHGQGWLPKYTGGLYDGRLIITRGLANTTWIPRIGNPKELVFVTLAGI